MEAAEDYLENCANMKVDIEALERFNGATKPRDLCKVHPEVLDERRQQYISSSSTQSEKQDHFVASRKRWFQSQGNRVRSKRVGKTSGMILSIKE